MSNSGFRNENNISRSLNEKKYSDLNENLKEFIKFISEKNSININDDTIVNSNVISNNALKPDILIEISDQIFHVSVKKGSGNSIHQEPISDFLQFMDSLEASFEEKEAMEWFICNPEYSRTLKKLNPDKIKLLNNFLKNNKKDIIIRALKTGVNKKNTPANYIYYGDENHGVYSDIDTAINKIISEDNSRATLAVGTTSLQAWNRTNKGKLNTVQLKWTRIKSDLESI